MCARVKTPYIGDSQPIFRRNLYIGYLNPFYWVDDHPLPGPTIRKKSINYLTNHACPPRAVGVPGMLCPGVSLACSGNLQKKPHPAKKHMFFSSVLAMGQEGSEKRWGDHCQYITLGSAHL